MKVLYISAFGTKTDPVTQRTYNLELTYETIRDRIKKQAPMFEFTHLSELGTPHEDFEPTDIFDDYEVIICDVTVANPNVMYLLGRIDEAKRVTVLIHEATDVPPVSLIGRRIGLYGEGRVDAAFIDSVQQTVTEALAEPSKFRATRSRSTDPTTVFLSYSHMDKKYLSRLLVHLKPLESTGLIDAWADTRLQAGDTWKEEIDKALQRAKIAVLLISADFMASDFIVKNELPPILKNAEVRGTRILPLIIKPCRFSREPSLSRFQAFNAPSDPLSGLEEDKAEGILDSIAETIERYVGKPSLSK